MSLASRFQKIKTMTKIKAILTVGLVEMKFLNLFTISIYSRSPTFVPDSFNTLILLAIQDSISPISGYLLPFRIFSQLYCLLFVFCSIHIVALSTKLSCSYVVQAILPLRKEFCDYTESYSGVCHSFLYFFFIFKYTCSFTG